MAAVRSHITIQRAVIGSEIKTLSTTADGEGLREREKEREQVAGKMTNRYNLSVCVCHPTDCSASVAGVHSQG